MEFATLNDACKAAVAGDTIAVQAGTYTNDFATVAVGLHIVAIGGMVNEVATTPPPNDKALLTVDANVSIQGFSFTGGSDGSFDGNVAGIRLENGSLAVSYCYFHDMQEGLLAGANPNATVTIDHSAFARNGTGDGYSHNLYVGAVNALTITNSYFTAANVGHEIKSRAATTIISNNVITDGPAGTASYDIDVPNAGVATITNNLIEKGAHASNLFAIHYGGEGQYAYAKNALTISGNTIVNDLGANGVAVLNQSAVNGLHVVAAINKNSFYGFDPARLLMGAGTVTGSNNLAAEPDINVPAPYLGLPILSIAAGPQALALSNSGHVVTGGVNRLSVQDSGGSNTITGGAGGLAVTATTGWDVITTQAGASDTVTLMDRNATVHSAGADHIAAGGLYQEVDATGQATITGSGFNTYNLNGAGERLVVSGGGVITVGAAGVASITDLASDCLLNVAAGGRAMINDQAAGAVNSASATVAGAASGSIGGSGAIALTLGDTGAAVQAGAGRVSVTCGAGADWLASGTGADNFVLGSGADRVGFGTGSATVTAGSGTDTYVFQSGQRGAETINGFRPGHDVLSFRGFSGNAIASGVVSSGATVLTLADGTSVTFAGVILPGYAAPASGGTPAGPGSPPVPTPGGLVLSTSGQVVTGGAATLAGTDLVGGNTVQGGAGGLAFTAADNDVLGTQAGTASTITLARHDTVASAGNDQIVAAGGGNQIGVAGTASVNLLGTGNLVQGGAGLLSVTDSPGGNSIAGGAGGLQATLAGQYDSVTTAQAATDAISLAGKSVLLSQGTDQVSVAGAYNQVTATGAASITAAAGFSSFVLDGADTLTSAGGGVVTVGAAGAATIAAAGLSDLLVTKLAGGTVAISESVPGGLAALTVSGAGATIGALAGAYAGLGIRVEAGDTVQAGSGNLTLVGGSGQDSFAGGSGAALITLGTNDTVSLGAGMLTLQGGTADHFVVAQDAHGTMMILNWSPDDSLVAAGQAAPAQSVSGGSDWLNYASGAQVELVGVGHMI